MFVVHLGSRIDAMITPACMITEDTSPWVQDEIIGGCIQIGMGCWLSPSTPCVGEAAGEDAENLAVVRRGQHLYARDPFDPFKAAAAWGD
jgi:hypothetical protein